MSEHFTAEAEGHVSRIVTVEDALKAHHLATADPEKDGILSSLAHELKYGLERAEGKTEHDNATVDRPDPSDINVSTGEPAAPAPETEAEPGVAFAAPVEAVPDSPAPPDAPVE